MWVLDLEIIFKIFKNKLMIFWKVLGINKRLIIMIKKLFFKIASEIISNNSNNNNNYEDANLIV